MSHDKSAFKGEKIYQRDKQIGFIVSLFLHGMLFLIAGAAFVKTAQYSIQSVPQSIQVDLIQAPEQEKITVKPQELKTVVKPVVARIKEDIFSQKIPEPKKTQAAQARAKPISSVAKLIEANPNYFLNPPPAYPELAKQMHQEGLVLLEVDVNAQGRPLSIKVVQSSSHHMLDEAALEAVGHWQFKPGTIGGIAVESRVTVPIRFKLQN